jgi:thiamine biosynthesis lipoprotein
MTTLLSEAAAPALWQPISTGDITIAVAQRAALGTSARIAVWPPENLGGALAAVDNVLSALDRQASRFRRDSEISWIHRGGGGLFMLSDGLAEAVSVALAAAQWTGGLVDPTVGGALISLGYDRDFAAIDPERRDPPGPPAPAPGWQRVRLDGPLLRLPPGVRLDLGATAKGLGSDRAARAALAAGGNSGGVLVSLGGDIAVGGLPPRDGWPILVADGPESDWPDPASSSRAQPVRLPSGAVATSSITCRRWRRAGRVLHHIVDPRTGLPADGPWRTVSVAAATCADANAAATAAIVAGEGAQQWLAQAGVPARLVAHDAEVRYVGGWPGDDGGRVRVPSGSHVYGGPPLRGVR